MRGEYAIAARAPPAITSGMRVSRTDSAKGANEGLRCK
jgi:hypothetical protein